MITRNSTVRWLRTALRNLNDEAPYIATDDPRAEAMVAERILKAVALLDEQPALGRAGRVPGTRELLIPNTRYLVPYRVRDGAVVGASRLPHVQTAACAAVKPSPRWVPAATP